MSVLAAGVDNMFVLAHALARQVVWCGVVCVFVSVRVCLCVSVCTCACVCVRVLAVSGPMHDIRPHVCYTAPPSRAPRQDHSLPLPERTGLALDAQSLCTHPLCTNKTCTRKRCTSHHPARTTPSRCPPGPPPCTCYICTNRTAPTISRQDHSLPLPERAGLALGAAGPSITLAASCEVLAFALGALLTPMPAVRNFSVCAALAVLLDFVLQVGAVRERRMNGVGTWD